MHVYVHVYPCLHVCDTNALLNARCFSKEQVTHSVPCEAGVLLIACCGDW